MKRKEKTITAEFLRGIKTRVKISALCQAAGLSYQTITYKIRLDAAFTATESNALAKALRALHTEIGRAL